MVTLRRHSCRCGRPKHHLKITCFMLFSDEYAIKCNETIYITQQVTFNYVKTLWSCRETKKNRF